MKRRLTSANPYMPLWEHVPDGEPRVFEYGGEKRVYVYGSHDTRLTEYCGDDYVAWSAPIDDLTDWKCHGVCYRSISGRPLYAPDVVEKDGVYYMYVAEEQGGAIYVVRSDKPWGPFDDPVRTQLGFDPGVLVDDDGRVYAYWGFCSSYAAELNDDMATIKEGTLVEHLIGHATAPWIHESEHADKSDAFFEASSPRKVLGKYVFIFSRRYEVERPELGVYADNNGFLSYKYSDSPLGGFIEGGDISFNGGEIIDGPSYDASGNFTGMTDKERRIMTYRWGNNHGSIMQVGDEWYVFYHRQTGTNEYSRQAMLERIDVDVDRDGHLYIGAIEYDGDQPVASHPVEMTSQGGHLHGIDARSLISAGYACHMYDGSGRSIYSISGPGGEEGVARDMGDEEMAYRAKRKMVIVPVYTPESGIDGKALEQLGQAGRVPIYGEDKEGEPVSYTLGIAHNAPGVYSSPITNIYNKATVGFKYLQFGQTSPATVTIYIKALDDGKERKTDVATDAGDSKIPLCVRVHADSYDGNVIARIDIEAVRERAYDIPVELADGFGVYCAELSTEITGKHAVYFEFISDDDEQAFAFDSFFFE